MLFKLFSFTLFAGLFSASFSLASNNNKAVQRSTKIVSEAVYLPAEHQQASSILENFRIDWQTKGAEELRAQGRHDLQISAQRASVENRRENEVQKIVFVVYSLYDHVLILLKRRL